MSKDCPICYEKISKIYRELSCGHKFHHKCLNIWEKYQDDISCPYCRSEYNNITLRSQTLSSSDQEKKQSFIGLIKDKLNEVSFSSSLDKNYKLKLINSILRIILINENMYMLTTKKFGFQKFVECIIWKLEELFEDIEKEVSKKTITDIQYNEFKSNRDLILKHLNQ